MSVTKLNTYEIGVNNDLTNALGMIDVNRVALDLTALELDTVPKVSIGSLIESQGSVYEVTGSLFTPTGSAVAGAYLFFDDTVPGFAWSTTRGTWDATRGGWYDGSDRRQCRLRLMSATEWYDLNNGPPGSIEKKIIEMGDWNMDSTASITVAHGLTLADIREVSVQMRDDAATTHYQWSYDNVAAGFFTTDGTNVTLVRTAAGVFDSTNFDATSFNRGWIIIRWKV